jgi:hypothetical protein
MHEFLFSRVMFDIAQERINIANCVNEAEGDAGYRIYCENIEHSINYFDKSMVLRLGCALIEIKTKVSEGIEEVDAIVAEAIEEEDHEEEIIEEADAED